MKNRYLNFRCKKCKSKTAKWTRLRPTKVHAYRVTCSYCDCFVGWGNERQFQQLLDAQQPLVTDVESPGRYPGGLVQIIAKHRSCAYHMTHNWEIRSA